MKQTGVLLIAAAIAWLNSADAIAQSGLPPRNFSVPPPGQNPSEKAELTHFNLDFPGGTPGQLVKAIEQAEGKPLNAIIPEDCANVQIPPLKMSNVTPPQLFDALMMASQKSENYITGTYFGGLNGQASSQYQSMRTSYGFRTQGTATDNSVWYFYHDAPAPPPGERPLAHTCRFFQMAPYLETYTIDDITTAIETGWKLLDDAETRNARGGFLPAKGGFGGGGSRELPKLTFHKDTKLLIAVGEPEKLKLIDSVLEQLKMGLGQKSADKPAKAKSDESSKP